MRNRYILIFLTLVLLLVPSISIIVTARTGSIYDPPNDLQKGDIVLLRWKYPSGILALVYWSHAMLCSDPDTFRFIHAWNGVENSTWSEVMQRTKTDGRGGLVNRAVVRLKYPPSGAISGAVKFANQLWQEGGHPYDETSQWNNLKQIKRWADTWWKNKLPPQGYDHNLYPSDKYWWIKRFSNYYYDSQGRWHFHYNYAQAYYCTELVWAAYFQGSHGNVYWERSPDPGAISGREILRYPGASNETYDPNDIHSYPYDDWYD